MQAAVPVGEGAMAAILGLDIEAVQQLAADASEGGVCTAANDNDPAQVVVSGHRAAVEHATAIAKERGAKRAMLLPVSAPFHCELMQPAAEAMAEALVHVDKQAPAVPVVTNVTARPCDDSPTIASLLIEQVTHSVRWRESVDWMASEGGDVGGIAGSRKGNVGQLFVHGGGGPEGPFDCVDVDRKSGKCVVHDRVEILCFRHGLGPL